MKPYQEGDWFHIPLEAGRSAYGLVARCRPGGDSVFGYFFVASGESSSESNPDLMKFYPTDAISLDVFSDLYLCNGRWPIVGRVADWNRHNWPMPLFLKIDLVSGEASCVEYPEDDPNSFGTIGLGLCGPYEIANLPKYLSRGSGAVECYLAAVISGSVAPRVPKEHLLRLLQEKQAAALSTSNPDGEELRDEDELQAVVVNLKLSGDGFCKPDEEQDFWTLEEQLNLAITESGVGELDGNEIGEGFWTLYCYGPNADRLFEVIFPIVKGFQPLEGSYVVKRYGEPGASEEFVQLDHLIAPSTLGTDS